MASENYIDDIVACINEVRVGAEQSELLAMESHSINNSFFAEVRISLNEVNSERSNVENVVDAVRSILATAEDSEGFADKKRMMTSVATHLALDVSENEQSIDVVLKFVNKYIELEPIGPFINGDLVLQGASYHTTHVPAVCKIEFAGDDEEDFKEVYRIMPWEMIYQPAEGETEDSVTIPIQLPPQCKEGSVHIKVYVDEAGKVPHSNADDNYDTESPSLILALDFTTTASAASTEMGNDTTLHNAPSFSVVTRLQAVPINADNAEKASSSELASAGLEPCAVFDIARGFNALPSAGSWQFALGTQRSTDGSSESVGIEDVCFITKEVDSAELEIPDGYEVDGLNLLAGASSNDAAAGAVHMAFKMGPEGRYAYLLPVSSEEETEEAAEESINEFLINAFAGGAEVKMAPAAVSQLYGFRVGLVCVFKGNSAADAFFASGGQIPTDEEEKAMDGADGAANEDAAVAIDEGDIAADEAGEDGADGADDVSRITGDGISSSDDEGDYEDEEDADDFNMDEEAISTLSKRLSELEVERERATSINAKLQRLCSAILARIGRDSQTRSTEPDANGGELGGPSQANPENNSEKEGHFAETIMAISDGRSKLIRQQTEYDQLALDLQTRLDDKEFKAEEITDSLNEFKREILLKAENSRTAKGISRRLIKHFEQTEQNKDSELEKVRLRNISLKTTLRRLEKTLRSREQLAEGLHMIDFEQLKIENQTLSEKIEERNEELAKLKRKKTVTVQILTHIREKLRHVTNENTVVREGLTGVDRNIVNARSNLTVSKHDRDVVRDENVELKRERGFATSDMLIIDFEKRKATMDDLTQSIRELRERHFLLSQQITTNKLTLKAASGLQTTQLPPIGKKR